MNDAEFAKKYFPRVTVECVVASRSMSETCYGMYGLKKMILEREAAGRSGRHMTFHIFDEANHMVSRDGVPFCRVADHGLYRDIGSNPTSQPSSWRRLHRGHLRGVLLK